MLPLKSLTIVTIIIIVITIIIVIIIIVIIIIVITTIIVIIIIIVNIIVIIMTKNGLLPAVMNRVDGNQAFISAPLQLLNKYYEEILYRNITFVNVDAIFTNILEMLKKNLKIL